MKCMDKEEKSKAQPEVDSQVEELGETIERTFDRIFGDNTLENEVKKDRSDGAFRGKRPFRL